MIYRFGGFELDVRDAQLRRGGLPVKLAPQPFAALVLLVERAGELVTRDEMREALWPGGEHVDFNAGLNFCMAQLRTALGDDAAQPSFIQTVPRRGYRFVASLDPAARSSEAPQATTVATPAAHASPVWIALIVVAAAVAALSATRWPRVPAPPSAGSSSLAAIAHREHAVLGLADASPGDLAGRIAELHQAIDADPSFSLAYADLAEAHLMRAQYRADAPQTAYANAKAAALRALELDPALATAHAAYAAAVLHMDWNWAAAREHFRAALRTDGDNPRVLYWYSRYLAASGRADEAVEAASRATRIDPAGVRTRANLGFVSVYARRYTEALATCEEALAMMAQFTPARFCAASAAMGSGALDKAVEHAAAQLQEPGDVEWLRDAVAKDGAAGYWRAEYRQIEVAGCDAHAASAAIALARLGDDEHALHWLERAAELHADTLIYLRVQPAFDRLRGAPRFEQVARRVGLPD